MKKRKEIAGFLEGNMTLTPPPPLFKREGEMGPIFMRLLLFTREGGWGLS